MVKVRKFTVIPASFALKPNLRITAILPVGFLNKKWDVYWMPSGCVAVEIKSEEGLNQGRKKSK